MLSRQPVSKMPLGSILVSQKVIAVTTETAKTPFQNPNPKDFLFNPKHPLDSPKIAPKADLPRHKIIHDKLD